MIPLGAHVTWILSWSGWQFPSSPRVQQVGQAGADVDVVGATVEVITILDVVLVDGVVEDLNDELVVVATEVVVGIDVVADVVVA